MDATTRQLSTYFIFSDIFNYILLFSLKNNIKMWMQSITKLKIKLFFSETLLFEFWALIFNLSFNLLVFAWYISLFFEKK